METAAAVEIRTVRGFPHAAWKSLAKNARLSNRSHNADCGSHFKIHAHFSLTFALNISYLSTVPNLVGRDIATIALWLGHERLETTHQYIEADLQLKEHALQQLEPLGQPTRRFKADSSLLTFLQSL